MDMRIPPLKFNTMLESNPLKSIILVRRLAVCLQGLTVLSARLPAESKSRLPANFG